MVSLQDKWKGRFPLVPGLDGILLPPGWNAGFERGFMTALKKVFKRSEESDLEKNLLALLSDLQEFLEKTARHLEDEKMRLTRTRVAEVLEAG